MEFKTFSTLSIQQQDMLTSVMLTWFPYLLLHRFKYQVEGDELTGAITDLKDNHLFTFNLDYPNPKTFKEQKEVNHEA